MSKFFKNYSKMMGNELASIVGEKGMIGDCEEFLDTGSYMLNAIMSADIFKGIPKNKTVAIASDSGIGKSFFCVSIAKEFRRIIQMAMLSTMRQRMLSPLKCLLKEVLI